MYALAKEADPRSDRTIGVLTKPDQIEEGCDESWRLMMLGGVGARFPLRLGWRMVRNPTKMEMDKGCSVDEATVSSRVHIGCAMSGATSCVLLATQWLPCLQQQRSAC